MDINNTAPITNLTLANLENLLEVAAAYLADGRTDEATHAIATCLSWLAARRTSALRCGDAEQALLPHDANKPPLPAPDASGQYGSRLWNVTSLCNYGTECFIAGEKAQVAAHAQMIGNQPATGAGVTHATSIPATDQAKSQHVAWFDSQCPTVPGEHGGQIRAAGEEVRKFYGSNYLLDVLLSKMQLRNDAALARMLEVTPLVISKVREQRLPVSTSLLIRMHELTGMSLLELRELVGDCRAKYQPSSSTVRTEGERAANNARSSRTESGPNS